jgi:CDGSH-type Zn-finger protein
MPINENECEQRTELVCDGRVALCRCWQSKKFPLCDGSHRQWNEDHNDHVGPIIVTPVQESGEV